MIVFSYMFQMLTENYFLFLLPFILIWWDVRRRFKNMHAVQQQRHELLIQVKEEVSMLRSEIKDLDAKREKHIDKIRLKTEKLMRRIKKREQSVIVEKLHHRMDKIERFIARIETREQNARVNRQFAKPHADAKEDGECARVRQRLAGLPASEMVRRRTQGWDEHGRSEHAREHELRQWMRRQSRRTDFDD